MQTSTYCSICHRWTIVKCRGPRWRKETSFCGFSVVRIQISMQPVGLGVQFQGIVIFICTFKLFEGPRTLWTSSTGSISEYCFVLLTPKWWHRNFFAFTLLQTCWNTSFSNLGIKSQSLRYAGITYYCSNLPLFICAQVAHTRQFIALDSASFCSPR